MIKHIHNIQDMELLCMCMNRAGHRWHMHATDRNHRHGMVDIHVYLKFMLKRRRQSEFK